MKAFPSFLFVASMLLTGTLVFGLSGLFVLGYVLIGGPIGNAAEAAARTFF